MGKNLDFNKIVYTVIGVLLVVIVVGAAIIGVKSFSNTKKSYESAGQDEMVYKGGKYEAKYSQIDEGELPKDSELAELGLENVKQTSKLNNQFNLDTYEINDGGIRYSYLANAVTSGERLYIYAKKMTEDEYKAMLPKAKSQNISVDGINGVFNDRTLYYTTDENSVPQNVKDNEAKGNVVVRYGNSTAELLPMTQIMWYENGIGYTLESISRTYTSDDMTSLLKDFINSTK